tara:strand:- start:286 stop:726 length:441 start_codon:yes stop_codon:yes gene_type:complete
MIHLIHENFTEDYHLSNEELDDFYEALHSIGKEKVLEAAHHLYHRSETPLKNYWEGMDEFKVTFLAFYKISRKLNKKDFIAICRKQKTPEDIDFEESEKKVLADSLTYKMQACFLLSFLDSMSDFLDYEITLMSLGYAPEKEDIAS